MSTFSGYNDKAPDLIPPGTLCTGIVGVRAIKIGSGSGARYMDLEITINRGPYEKRKVWTNVMDPADPQQSAGGKEMGQRAIIRMFETAGIFVPGNLQSYQQWDGATIEQIGAALVGKEIAFSVKIESQEGYADKNGIGDFLTPNPSSAVAAKWKKLLAQLQNPQAPAAPAQSAFAMAAPVAAKPAGFGTVAAPAAPAAPAGFGNGAAPVAPLAGTGTITPAPLVPTTPATLVAPGAVAPNWLAQANGQ
jgi:hypothetical protein